MCTESHSRQLAEEKKEEWNNHQKKRSLGFMNFFWETVVRLHDFPFAFFHYLGGAKGGGCGTYESLLPKLSFEKVLISLL